MSASNVTNKLNKLYQKGKYFGKILCMSTISSVISTGQVIWALILFRRTDMIKLTGGSEMLLTEDVISGSIFITLCCTCNKCTLFIFLNIQKGNVDTR
jgi:hypothetical protein